MARPDFFTAESRAHEISSIRKFVEKYKNDGNFFQDNKDKVSTCCDTLNDMVTDLLEQTDENLIIEPQTSAPVSSLILNTLGLETPHMMVQVRVTNSKSASKPVEYTGVFCIPKDIYAKYFVAEKNDKQQDILTFQKNKPGAKKISDLARFACIDNGLDKQHKNMSTHRPQISSGEPGLIKRLVDLFYRFKASAAEFLGFSTSRQKELALIKKQFKVVEKDMKKEDKSNLNQDEDIKRPGL